MKKLLNIGESILLFVALFITVFSITMFNKNYIKFELKRHNYYNTIINNIKNELTGEYILNDSDVINDVNNYIDSYYVDKQYSSKINYDDSYRSLYNSKIRFIGPFKNIRLYRDIFDIATIIFVLLTGILFIKTKTKHNIDFILVMSSVMGIIASFVVLMMNNYDGIVQMIIKDYYHIYLGMNVFLLIIPLYKKVMSLIVKNKR